MCHSFGKSCRFIGHYHEGVVDEDFRVIEGYLVMVDDVFENSSGGLSHTLRVISGWLLGGNEGWIVVIITGLRKFPFFHASVAKLIDKVVDS